MILHCDAFDCINNKGENNNKDGNYMLNNVGLISSYAQAPFCVYYHLK